MAQVPYQPFPNVSPTGATPRVGVNTPADAFGAGIARAVEGFGGQAEHVGDELFSRAVQIQGLKLESEVNDAANKFLSDGGVALEKYQTTVGQEAVQGQEPFLDNIKTMRESARAGLSNDYARRLFDRETFSTGRYFTVHSAGHAATQARQWNKNSLQAAERADEDLVEKTPFDQGAWDMAWGRVRESAYKLGRGSGWPDQQTENYIADRESLMISRRARGMSKTDTQKAMDFLNANSQYMHDKDWNSVAPVVMQEHRGVVARTSSDNVNAHHEGPGYWPGMSEKERQIAEGVSEPLSRVMRQVMIDNPELKARLTSGFRSPEHNLAVGGAKNSKHLSGDALDWVGATGVEDGIAKAQAAADKLGIKVNFEPAKDSKDHVHISLAPTTLDAVPKPIPESPASRVARARAHSEEVLKGDQWVGPMAANRATGDYNRIAKQVRDQQRDYNQAVASVVIGSEGVPVATSAEDVRHRLEQKYGNTEAWDNLSPQQQLHYGGLMSNGLKVKTDLARYRGLVGMAWSDDPEKQREFTYLDLTQEQLDGDKLRILSARKEKLIGKPESDPRLSHAKGLMPPGLTRDMDKDEKDQLDGQMVEQLQLFHQMNKVMPSDKDITQLWNNLTVKQTIDKSFLGWHWKGKDDPYFKHPLEEKEIQAEYAGFIQQFGIEPTREQAEKAARINRYLKTFGGPATKEKTPAAAPRPE